MECLLVGFFSFDGFGGKMKMTAINDFVLATHFLQAEVEDSSHCLSSACLPRSAWRRQAGRAAGDGSLWCLLQLLPYDPHGQRSWPARTDHWPETLSVQRSAAAATTSMQPRISLYQNIMSNRLSLLCPPNRTCCKNVTESSSFKPAAKKS